MMAGQPYTSAGNGPQNRQTLLHLTLACGDYDRTRSLINGRVAIEAPAGSGVRIETTVLPMTSPDRHWRMLRNREFDISEMSMSSYLLSKGIPGADAGLTAIPVFPHRRFRHSYAFINRRSGITRPEDLQGKRIGVRTYQATASVWIKGFLQHDYGVSPYEVEWWAEQPEYVGVDLPPRLKIRQIPESTTADAMLVAGEIEAIIYPEIIPSYLAGHPDIGLLIPDYPAVERDYFRRTGLFPIMHTVVIRDELLAAYPWLARAVRDAFETAKQDAYRYLREQASYLYVWIERLMEEERQVMGSDPWPYNLRDNRRALQALIDYEVEQGLLPHRLAVEELFIDVD